MIKVLLGILFLPLVFTDLKEKKVSCPYLIFLMILFAGLDIISRIIFLREGGLFDLSRIAALLMGILFLLSGLYFRKSIGVGDSLSVLLFALVSELWELTVLILISFSLTGLLGLILFVLFRRKHMEVPFLPFLAVGWWIVLWLGR